MFYYGDHRNMQRDPAEEAKHDAATRLRDIVLGFISASDDNLSGPSLLVAVLERAKAGHRQPVNDRALVMSVASRLRSLIQPYVRPSDKHRSDADLLDTVLARALEVGVHDGVAA